MIFPVVIYNNTRLRKKCAPIVSITDEIKELVSSMEETMRHVAGIGLAAPQVDQSLRVFIICLDAAEYPKEVKNPTEKIQVFINPKISKPSEECDVKEEGCLSIPGIHGYVERPLKIHVEATDLDGNQFSEDAEGWRARIIMHENDHINGVLFIDRMNKQERKRLDQKLYALNKEHSS